jgi:hypothetical protein
VVLDGVAMDRVSRESRYLAAKLSMLRQAVANGVIKLTKIATELNPADIFTKPLVGEGLDRARRLVLGHPPSATPKVVGDSGPRGKPKAKVGTAAPKAEAVAIAAPKARAAALVVVKRKKVKVARLTTATTKKENGKSARKVRMAAVEAVETAAAGSDWGLPLGPGWH